MNEKKPPMKLRTSTHPGYGRTDLLDANKTSPGLIEKIAECADDRHADYIMKAVNLHPVLVEALQLADHLEALYKEKDSLEAMIYNDGKYTQEQFDRAIWLGQEIIRTFATIHSALAQVRGK